MKASKHIDQHLLKSILDYNESTGVFRWKVLAGNRILAGSNAGSIDKESGYIVIRIKATTYLAHRLAYIWMTGEAPDMIDHRNTIKTDNAWLNLRPTNHVLNAQNSKARSTNVLGLKGITLTPSGTYHARVTPTTGKRISKSFKRLDDAIAFVEAQRTIEHKQFANSG